MTLQNDLLALIESEGEYVMVNRKDTRELLDVSFNVDTNKLYELSRIQYDYVTNKLLECRNDMYKMIGILSQDLYSRQVCFTLNLEGEYPNCIVSIHFLIRNNVLHCFVYQRSLDVKNKLHQDIYFVQKLLHILSNHFRIKETKLRFIIGSLHYYL